MKPYDQSNKPLIQPSKWVSTSKMEDLPINRKERAFWIIFNLFLFFWGEGGLLWL